MLKVEAQTSVREKVYVTAELLSLYASAVKQLVIVTDVFIAFLSLPT